MMIRQPILAVLLASILSFAVIDAAAAQGFGLNVGPLFNPAIDSAIGGAVSADAQSSSAAGGAMNSNGGSHVQLGCIDAARFPDFVNVPPTPCTGGKWPTH